MILLDTSGLLLAIDVSQRMHEQCIAAVQQAGAPLLLSPFVLAELDYLLATRIGVREEIQFLEEVGSGAYQLEAFSADDVASAREVLERYQDLGIGLAMPPWSFSQSATRRRTSSLWTSGIFERSARRPENASACCPGTVA